MARQNMCNDPRAGEDFSDQIKQAPKGTLKRFLKYYRPHMGLLVADLVCALLMAGIDLAFPQILNSIINCFRQGLGQLVIDNLAWIGIGLVAMYVVSALCKYFINGWGHIMGARMEADMRQELFEKYQALGFDYYDRNKTGDMMSRVTNDLFDISEFAHHGPETFIIAGLEVIGAFALLALTCWQLSLIMFAITGLLAVYALWKNIGMRTIFRAQRTKISGVNTRLQDSLGGVKVVKSFSNENHEIGRFRVSNSDFLEAKNASYINMGQYGGIINLFTGILYTCLIVIGGTFVAHGVIDAQVLVMYALYIGIFMNPLTQLINFTENFQRGYSGFVRFCEIIDEKPSVEDLPGAVELAGVRGHVEFKDVGFAYGPELPQVLQGLSLDIQPGKTVALVGPSGGGKTTVCSLLPRFYDVTQGSVCVDGRDIREYTVESLRRAIGVVQQDVYLFDGTIRDNIAYGKLGATDAEVEQAARRAGVDEFALKLADGYDTLVGERGTRLSGGQKQRISIARMFLKNPAILVLDEATSALDNESEAYIQASLEELSSGKTCLVIAHRLSTIRNADEIVVIRDGQVEQRGTHEELLAAGGTYKEYYEMQFQVG
ncbi:MAG: ABC transporter ATP-binding protein [Coriobacteriales bacterium]